MTPHTWTVQILGGGTLTIRCTSVSYDGLTPSASGTLTSFIFNFHPSSCTMYDYGRDWTTCTSFTFHLVWFNCDITYGYVSTLGGVLVDDRDASDTTSVGYTTAAGSRVSWNVSLPYTTNCPSWRYPPSGTGRFDGTAFFPRIWVGP